jgi:hypothetical protein
MDQAMISMKESKKKKNQEEEKCLLMDYLLNSIVMQQQLILGYKDLLANSSELSALRNVIWLL